MFVENADKFFKTCYFRTVFSNKIKAMKRTATFKTILVCASLLSLSAFAFVNLSTHTAITHPFSQLSATQAKLDESEMEESRELSVPDVNVIGRVYGIAKRLLDKAN
jgi:hypothetical protein